MKHILMFLMLLISVSGGFAQHEHHHPPKPEPPKTAPAKKTDQKKPAASSASKSTPVKKTTPKKVSGVAPVKKAVKAEPVQQKPAPKIIIQKSGALPPDSMEHQHIRQEGIYFVKPADTGSHQQHHHDEHTAPPEPADAMAPDHHKESGHGMRSMLSAAVPASRDGSGTSWMSDESPVYAQMEQTGKWHLMLHYAVFLRYTNQDILEKGKRGAEHVDAPNWLMIMAGKTVGQKGFLFFRQMLSLDPWTIGAAGYPLLFQTGEIYKGRRLVDAQHPHDLFSELAAGYSYSFNKSWDAFVYAGLPGEPALGPGAFMHRPSSAGLPSAPLSHHWQDASHITYGVVTAGLRFREWKADFSLFRGQEPDENRLDIEQPWLDSYSGRLTFNPARSLSFQASAAFLNEPELIEPGVDQVRATLSAQYGRNNALSSALIWGANREINALHDEMKHAILAEANWLLTEKISLSGRAEAVQKSSHELVLEQPDPTFEDIYWVNALSLGIAHALFRMPGNSIDIGGALTMYPYVEPDIQAVYGKELLSGEIFIRLRPSGM